MSSGRNMDCRFVTCRPRPTGSGPIGPGGPEPEHAFLGTSGGEVISSNPAGARMKVAIYVTRVTRVNEFMRADDVDPRRQRVRNAGRGGEEFRWRSAGQPGDGR